MFSTRTSPSKWVTDPALDVGTPAASPMAKTFGLAVDCNVCSSTGTKPNASPSPGDLATYRAPPCRVDTEAQFELTGSFGIQSIPALTILRDQVVVYSEPGAVPAELLEESITRAGELDMAEVRRQVQVHQ